MKEAIVVVLLFFGYAIQMYILVGCIYVLSSGAFFILFFKKINCLFTDRTYRDVAIPSTEFVLLIPAHNEERLLPKLLGSIQLLNYPPQLYKTIVIADNCSDKTAAVATKPGIICLERFTPLPSSKAQALLHALEALPAYAPSSDAVVCIIDADCELEADYLLALNSLYCLPGAAPVVQSYRSVRNTFDSEVTVLDAAAEALRHWVLSGTRKILGMDGFIFGLGCSMRLSVLTALMMEPNKSLAEDKEWKVYMTEHNIRVDYCPVARLSYEAVSDSKAFQKQRKRWLAGYYEALKTSGVKMLIQGIRRASLTRLDLAGDLLQPPRSVLIFATAFFGMLGLWFSRLTLLNPWAWFGITFIFLIYGSIGMWLIGARPRHYFLLVSGLRLIKIIINSIFEIIMGKGVGVWDATRDEVSEGVQFKTTRPFSKQEIGPVSDALSDAQRPVPMTDEKGIA